MEELGEIKATYWVIFLPKEKENAKGNFSSEVLYPDFKLSLN